MRTILEIKNILIYSEENNKVFFTEFDKKLNVIYGKNTAGKSSLIQLILYAFGINDNKIKLVEILSEGIFVRLDCVLTKGSSKMNYSFVRQDETLVIQDNNNKVLRFNGISGDSSAEHVKLKNYFNELFDFNLLLESNSGISKAPMETIFLPYYISQEVGWVYLRKSFSNLNFYKNFKEDYLDYYLEIENVQDRDEKRKIEREIQRIQREIKFFTNIESENSQLKIAETLDDSLSGKANELINEISNLRNDLLKLENKYVSESNQLTYYSQRLSVISKVKRNHKGQEPAKDSCPTCTQILPSDLSNVYQFFQEENDTIVIQKDLKGKIKKQQSSLNSLNKKIETQRANIKSLYDVFKSYSEEGLSIDNYIDHKANIQLFKNLKLQLGQLTIDIEEEKEKLTEYKTDHEILIAREKKNQSFKSKYLKNNIELGLPIVDDEKFYKLYEISSFPFQGVQLHLAVLSYHFAFNALIKDSQSLHRLPFILDSVFKEDIEGGNKKKILSFITKNYPKDTQTILSIADDKETDSMIDKYKTEILKEHAKMICIGGGSKEKALLGENDNKHKELIDNTFELLETI